MIIARFYCVSFPESAASKAQGKQQPWEDERALPAPAAAQTVLPKSSSTDLNFLKAVTALLLNRTSCLQHPACLLHVESIN